MRRSYKFRLYPTKPQERDMTTVLDSHRHLYNRCLGQRIQAYSWHKISINYCDQSSWLKAERKSNDFFKRLNFSSSQATMRRLDRAFQNFFGRLKSKKGKPGFPRFKSSDSFNSFLFPSHGDGCRFKDGRLRVTGIGSIKVNVHREVLGEIKTLSVKREANKWFLVLSCEIEDVVVPRSTKPAVGIDMGLESFLTTSNGEHVANPRFQKLALPELRIANRRLARRSRSSNRRRKARLALKKVHCRIANRRRDFVHKLSRCFAGRYGLIAAEGLRVRNMLKNRRLARSISDAAWTAFLEAVRYKVEETGAEFAVVDPRYTSQACSGCGCIVEKPLSVRRHDCPSCGLSLHRDVNAARNILFLALARTGPTNVKPALRHERSPVLVAAGSFEKPLASASG